ncbi:MAG: mechanosensitive ion channel family protein [Oscillospiraceae bacterium]
MKEFITLYSGLMAENAVENVMSTAKEETEKVTDILSKLADMVLDILPKLVYAVIILIIGLMLVKSVVKVVLAFMQKANVDETLHGFVKSLLTIVLDSLVVIIVLTLLNVPMDSIVTTLGAATLAIGLALQGSLANIAGGFLLLITKPFKVGDFIECGDIVGTVENISILNTTIVTADNKTIHTPNGNLSNVRIVNYNQKNKRRLDLKFSISYDSDYKEAKKIILNLIDNHKLALHEEGLEPVVRVGEHGDNAIIIYARVWVLADNYWDLNFDLLEQVKDEFDKNGIDIPYNHLNVHIDK